jgi:AAA+ ATPase superfamily predicted ATPase
MSISPFRYGRPINNPGQFIGRRREIEQVYSRLLSAGESTSIVGERRTGKTSLLKILAHPATQAKFSLDPKKHVFIYQDFQYLEDETVPTRFWQRVLRTIRRAVRSHEEVVAEIEFSLKDNLDNYTLDDIFTLIDEEDLHIVLLMDEFENVTRNQNFDNDFFGGLRALAIHHNLALITSSRRDLVELTHSDELRSSPFFNIFASINLRSFSETEAMTLIDTYLANSDVKFLLSEFNVIFAIAGYHVYLLQMACHHLFAAYQEGLDDAARRRYLLDQVRREAGSIFHDYWHNSSSSQQILLAVLAMRELENKEEEDSVEVLERFYTRTAQVITELERRILVVKNPETSAYHLFSTELREWIADEIVGNVEDLRAWRDWQRDETLVGELSLNLQDMLAQVVRGLNPAYRKTLGNWLLEPSTAMAALLLVQNFVGSYEHYKVTRPERDAASTMADEEEPVGDTPKGIFAMVSKRLEDREQGKPDLSLGSAIKSLNKQQRDQEIYSRKRRLLDQTKNLNKLLERAAKYGSRSDAPLDLQNDIEEIEDTIARLENELEILEQDA